MAEVEDVARAAAARDRTSSASRSTTSHGAVSAAGSRLPCTARSPTRRPAVVEREPPVEPDHVAARAGEVAEEVGRAGSEVDRRHVDGAEDPPLHGATRAWYCAGDSVPTQESKSCTTSAPAATFAATYEAKTSASRSINASQVSGSESISAFVRGSSRLGLPSTR